MWLLIIVLIAVVLIVAVSAGGDAAPSGTSTPTEVTSFQANAYKGGHPSLDNELKPVYLNLKDAQVEISSNSFGWSGNAAIKYEQVKNIVVEDATTFEKRVTLGRVLLVGIFALAWKKNKKNEASYLTIDWNDGRFDHQSIFEFDGVGSLNRANTTRNAIIKKITSFEAIKNENNG
jgi:hypothetical protein